ncbi:MAG: hypothetical protein HY302_12130 [Opitutae bacterium]|nr:hypothetical protein [Opitutae bacterium]
MIQLDDLLRQARRLRFADAAMEEQFHEERQREGLTRVRVMHGLAVVFVAVIGLKMALSFPRDLRWMLAEQLHYRFFVVVPAWLLVLGSTIVPGHVRRAEWLYAGAALVAVWGLIVMDWFWVLAAGARANPPISLLTLDFIEVLVLATFTLPLRVRWQAALSLGSAAGALAFLGGALPPNLTGEFSAIATNLGFAAVATLALAAWRERSERTIFVQREHGRGLNAALEKSNAALARLNAEKSEFMAVAAHDLRAPLGVVRGTLELLRGEKISDPARRAEALARAHGETGRMLTLVNNYLGDYAAESGTLPVRLARLDLGAQAATAAARHAGAAERKAQTLAVEAPTGRVWVTADETLLAQVSDNFLSNALKFSAPGTAVRVELHVAEAGGVARLAVIDEGPGIAPEEQGRLFEKFGRTSVRPTAGEPSLGLGLAVAKRLAAAMGGSVGCESPANDRGAGALFWVELPLTP